MHSTETSAATAFECYDIRHNRKRRNAGETWKAKVTDNDLFDDQKTARVSVLLPLPLAGAYDYRLPAELTVGPGDIVEVPLGQRRLHGVVWGAASGDVDAKRLKTVLRRYPIAPLPASVRALVDWVAAYTLASNAFFTMFRNA